MRLSPFRKIRSRLWDPAGAGSGDRLPFGILLVLIGASPCAFSTALAAEDPPSPTVEVVPAAGIPWMTDMDEANAAAGKAGKPLLIDFGAEWCGFCKKLDRETFGDERVIRLVRDGFIPVRVDTQEQPELARKHAVTGLPTVIFVTPSGEELHRIVGFVPPEDFLSRAAKFGKAAQALEDLKKAAESEPANVEAQRAYARALFASGNYEGACRVIEKTLEVVEETSRERAGLLLDLGDALRLAGKAPEACDAYRKLLSMDAESGGEERSKAYLPLSRLLVSQKGYEDALPVLDALIADAGTADEDRLQALFLRAYVHAVRKKVPEALADLKVAREGDPEGRWGLRAGWILDIVESQ